MHIVNKPLTCPHCPGKIFDKKKALLSHKSAVHKEKKLQCSKCSKKFTFKSLLDRHEKHHVHICNLCHESFKNHKKLQRHRLNDHGIRKKPLKTYYCCTCKIEFENIVKYKTHKEKEHSTVEFECEICKKSYKYKKNLKDHIKKNHEGQKFLCTFDSCGAECDSKRLLKLHIKSHKTTKTTAFEEYFSDTSVIDLITANKEWRKKDNFVLQIAKPPIKQIQTTNQTDKDENMTETVTVTPESTNEDIEPMEDSFCDKEAKQPSMIIGEVRDSRAYNARDCYIFEDIHQTVTEQTNTTDNDTVVLAKREQAIYIDTLNRLNIAGNVPGDYVIFNQAQDIEMDNERPTTMLVHYYTPGQDINIPTEQLPLVRGAPSGELRIVHVPNVLKQSVVEIDGVFVKQEVRKCKLTKRYKNRGQP